MKTLSLTCAIAVALGLMTLATPAKAVFEISEQEIGLVINDMEVGNMPLSIRDIPIHPDDEYGAPGPIAQTEYKTGAVFLSKLSFNQYQLGNVKVKPRLILNVSFLGTDIARRNYTNAPGTEKRGLRRRTNLPQIGRTVALPDFQRQHDQYANQLESRSGV